MASSSTPYYSQDEPHDDESILDDGVIEADDGTFDSFKIQCLPFGLNLLLLLGFVIANPVSLTPSSHRCR